MSTTAIGQPNSVAIGFFILFIVITLGITYWAARRTRTTWARSSSSPRRIKIRSALSVTNALVAPR